MSELEKVFPKPNGNKPNYPSYYEACQKWELRREGALWALKWINKNHDIWVTPDIYYIRKEIEQLEKESNG